MTPFERIVLEALSLLLKPGEGGHMTKVQVRDWEMRKTLLFNAATDQHQAAQPNASPDPKS